MNSMQEKIREKLPALQADVIEGNLIIYPKTCEEVSSFVKLCNYEKISIVPIGSGTQIIKAHQPGVYLSTRKMNKIVELARDDLTVSVEAGISIKELAGILREYNFLLPVSYYEKPNSTIGGLLARDAGGIEQYARGTIHDYLLGLEFVTPTGEIIKTGGKTVKNVTGYDFTRLFAKSWGTLGVIVKATFKLIPMPAEKALFITHAASIDDLARQMKEVLAKRYALVSFMGMSGRLLELDESSSYGGVFVLAGSRQAVAHQLDTLKSLLYIERVITGVRDVDDYLEKLLENKAVQADIIFGTDRRTLLDYMPKELDAVLDSTSMNIFLDGGSGLVKLTAAANAHEIKNVLKERLQEFNIWFSDERAPVDILYNRVKRNLDPNLIMYPNNPRFVEVC